MKTLDKVVLIIISFVALISVSSLAYKVYHPHILLLDDRTFLITTQNSNIKIQDAANLVCGNQDCSKDINSLFRFVPKTGGIVRFTGGIFIIETSLKMEGKSYEIVGSGLDSTIIRLSTHRPLDEDG